MGSPGGKLGRNICVFWPVESPCRGLSQGVTWLTGLIFYACAQLLNHVQLFGTPWTVARHVPLSMGFSRQEYCSGLPFPSRGDLLDPGMEPVSLASPASTGRLFTTSATGDAHRL